MAQDGGNRCSTLQPAAGGAGDMLRRLLGGQGLAAQHAASQRSMNVQLRTAQTGAGNGLLHAAQLTADSVVQGQGQAPGGSKQGHAAKLLEVLKLGRRASREADEQHEGGTGQAELGGAGAAGGLLGGSSAAGLAASMAASRSFKRSTRSGEWGFEVLEGDAS